jgi:ribosomal protein S27AE
MIVSPTGITDDERKRLGEYLNSRGAKEPCPRCRHSLFYVVDMVSIPFKPAVPFLGPSLEVSVSALLTSCANCGFIAMHNLDVLQPQESK